MEGIGGRLGRGHLCCILRVCSAVSVNWNGVVENGMLNERFSEKRELMVAYKARG